MSVFRKIGSRDNEQISCGNKLLSTDKDALETNKNYSLKVRWEIGSIFSFILLQSYRQK